MRSLSGGLSVMATVTVDVMIWTFLDLFLLAASLQWTPVTSATPNLQNQPAVYGKHYHSFL